MIKFIYNHELYDVLELTRKSTRKIRTSAHRTRIMLKIFIEIYSVIVLSNSSSSYSNAIFFKAEEDLLILHMRHLALATIIYCVTQRRNNYVMQPHEL